MKVVEILSNLFKNPKRRIRARTAGLHLESLEDRVVPTGSNDWIGPNLGAWSDPANWSLGRAPESGDTLNFRGPISGGVNTSSVDDIPSLTVEMINQDADFSATITLAVGASLTSTIDITAYGNFSLTGANTLVASSGTLYNYGVISSDGAGNVIGAGNVFLAQGGLTVTGPFTSGTPNLRLIGHTILSGTLTVGNPNPAGQDAVVAVGEPDVESMLELQAGSVTTLGPGSVLSNPSHLLQLTGTLRLVDATLDSPLGVEIHGILDVDSASLSSDAQDTITGNVYNNGGSILFTAPSYQNLVVYGTYSDFVGTISMRAFGALGGYSDTFYASGGFSLTNNGILNVTVDGTSSPGQSWGLLLGQVTGRFGMENLPMGFYSSYNGSSPGYSLSD